MSTPERDTAPSISLVVPTFGRTDELHRLLVTLVEQTVPHFEVIIVDQNEDRRIEPILKSFTDQLSIEWIRTDKSGASRARNIGAEFASAPLLTFPDDDSWYPETLVEDILDFFEQHPDWDALSVRATNGQGQNAVTRWHNQSGTVTRLNEMNRSVEFGMVFKTSVFQELGGYDNQLGPGANTRLGAHEGSDLNIRALKGGYSIYYRADLKVHHPVNVEPENPKKARSYARGMGWVHGKYGLPLWFEIYLWMRSVGGILYSVILRDWQRVRFYRATLLGRIEGWWMWK